jgi:hypothetical protein
MIHLQTMFLRGLLFLYGLYSVVLAAGNAHYLNSLLANEGTAAFCCSHSLVYVVVCGVLCWRHAGV